MFDTVKEWIGLLADFWNHYTDVGCLLVGALAGVVVGLCFESFFVPENWPKRKQMAWTHLVTYCVSWLAASCLWWALDPADPLRMRVTVAGVVSTIVPIIYIYAAKYLSTKFPSIGSVFASPPALPQ